VGPFTEDDAWSIEALEQAPGPEDYLIDLGRARALFDRETIAIPERPL
jgi:hypothetical protein